MFNQEAYDKLIAPETASRLRDLPYDVVRRELYTAADLFDKFDPAHPESVEECLDTRIGRHVWSTGRLRPQGLELYARAMHDANIRKALYLLLEWFEQKRVFGVMGGHALKRTDTYYRRIVEVSKMLTERGELMLSGGGPGAMEATHVGAWLAGRMDAEVEAALEMLGAAPDVANERWLAVAFETMKAFPQTKGFVSVSIPTWQFSSEPPTPFATYIAKLFENSLREDILLTESFGGVLYTPGGAGTLQEIFQEAVQNHYVMQDCLSPMIFVGRDFWTKEVPVYPLMTSLQDAGRYQNLQLSLVDTTDEIIAAIDAGRATTTAP